MPGPDDPYDPTPLPPQPDPPTDGSAPSDGTTTDTTTTTDTSGGTGGTDTGDGNPPPPVPGLDESTANQSFSVPGDLVGPINDIAAQYGIPYPIYLALAVHQLVGFAKTKINEQKIVAIAQAIQRAYQSQLGSRGVSAAQTDPSTVRDLWSGAVSRVAGISKQTVDNETRKAPPTTGNVGFQAGGAGAAGAAPIVPGLSNDAGYAVQRVADNLFLQYLGHLPTTADYLAISAAGYTAQTLEQHLRSQPDPRYKGYNVGQSYDLIIMANTSAQTITGNDATPGEINWMIENHIPINKESLDAFYTQVKTGAVWASVKKDGITISPKDWLAMQARVQKVWDSYGLTGTVPWQMVNDAAVNGLTDQQITEKVKAQPAPGMPAGMNVGEADRLRQIAQPIKDKLFPGETVTPEELVKLAGMSPAAITDYFRSLPARDVPGVNAGQASDYRTMADKFFASMGITDYQPTAQDLNFLAVTKADYSSLAEHFGSKPDLLKKYPGLAFGMSTTDYTDALSGYGSALEGVFGKGASMGAFHPTGLGKQQRESSLYGAALADKMSPTALASTVEQFRQARGRAPSGDELRTFRDTPRTKFAQTDATPSYSQTDTGPASSALGGASKGAAHPA
jgi:hypothetical protein